LFEEEWFLDYFLVYERSVIDNLRFLWAKDFGLYEELFIEVLLLG
jgi:hypothetical protein